VTTAPSPAAEPAPLSAADIAARALLGLCIVLALVIVFFLSLNPISITDFWWQAKTGELIVRNGSIPRLDPFSWTAKGEPWVVHEWLAEVFFYFAATRLPDWMLLGYKCGLGVLACGLVLVRGWARSGSVVLGIVAALWAAFILRNYTDLRPQMFSFVLLVGVLLALDEYRAGRLERLPWALPVVFALWANLHGGVVVGLVLVGLWVAGEALSAWLFDESKEGLSELVLGVAVSCVAVALNPNGFRVYTYPFEVLGHPEVMDYITEWYAPTSRNIAMRPFLTLLLACLGTLAVARGAAGVRLGDALVLCASGYAALMAQRNTATFGLVAAPLLVAGLAALWRDAAPLERVRELFRPAALRAAALLPLLCGLALLLVWVVRHYQIPWSRPGTWYEYGTAMASFPRDAVRKMQDGAWEGPLYNDYEWGGYLIWKLYPTHPVFIDGRAEVYYPSKVFDDEMRIHRVADGWHEALDRRGVEVVLTNRFEPLAAALSRTPGWKRAFDGPVEVVFVRDAEESELPPLPMLR